MLESFVYIHRKLPSCSPAIQQEVRSLKLRSICLCSVLAVIIVFARGRTTLPKYLRGALLGGTAGYLNSYMYIE